VNTIIVFKIGEENIGIDIGKVREVTEVQSLVYVPMSPNFLLGLTNIRGDVVPVVSLKKRLGFEEEEKGNVLIIVEDDGRIAGLKVDELYGTKKLAEATLNKNSELLSTKKERDFFLGVYETEEQPILLLNLKKVLSKEDK